MYILTGRKHWPAALQEEDRMSRWSLLLVAASYLGVCTAAVEVPAPILNKTNEASECIPPDVGNYTATCFSPSGWLIGDYAMVDRDQFDDEESSLRMVSQKTRTDDALSRRS